MFLLEVPGSPIPRATHKPENKPQSLAVDRLLPSRGNSRFTLQAFADALHSVALTATYVLASQHHTLASGHER